MAQTVYYFTAAVALGAPHRKIAFTVPTGNFGDIYAGYVAQRMGLPIDRLVIATNVNDILARTLATGAYELRDVVATTSPSMDIQVSSNFERLLFDAYERDAGAGARADGIAGAVAALHAVGARAVRRSARVFSADRADEEEVVGHHRAPCGARPAISSIRTPPSASRSPRRSRAIRRVPMVVLSTAHPAKFPDAVEAAPAARPALPDWLSDLNQRPRAHRPCCRPINRGRAIRPVDEPRRAAKERPHERRGDHLEIRPPAS